MKFLGKGSKKAPRSRIRLRPLIAFRNLRKEIGRAAESGGTLHIALGSGGLTGENAVMSLAGIELLEALADIAVLYNTPPIVTVGDPTLLPLAQDAFRRAYERHNMVHLYDPNHIRFLALSPAAYAAGAAGIVASEDVTGNVMIGAFGPEVSLIADAGTRRGLPQMAAAATAGSMGALYPVADHLAVGEELYAASAQITGKRRFVISLSAQDWLRFLLVVVILLMAIPTLLGSI